MSTRVAPALVAGAAAVLWLAIAAPPASAQAFSPPKGEGDVTIEYQGSIIKQHLTMTGPKDNGRIDSQALVTDFTLGIGHGMAVSVGLPFIAAKYTGNNPHVPAADEMALLPNFKLLDNGVYHGSFQDVHAEVRRTLRVGQFVVTPFVGGIIPSHNYEYLSHSAVGRDVRELQVGAYAAGRLGRWLPDGFFQIGFAHGFEQTIATYARQRDVLTFEAGYFVTPRWRVYGVGTGQVTHGGIEIQSSVRAEYHGLAFVNHDRIVRTDLLDVGAGTAFSISDRLDLLASFSKTVWGINGHAQWLVVNVGMSFSIGRHGRPGTGDRASCPADADHESQLQKCVCLRK